ncbi:uncharacterized protein [Watersipora subatra]|uniref:uncharacterized protein n=1 Tax=Watersipora subatra TaxID=2589382 RepID=UPI00355B34B2
MLSTLFSSFMTVFLIHSSNTQAECDETTVRQQWNTTFCIFADGCDCKYSKSRGYCEAGRLYIDLSSCHISTLKGFTKNINGMLPMLERLNLTDNSISQLARDDFTGDHFKSLRVLDLTFNMVCYLSSTFERGVFAGLNQLQSLSLTLVTRSRTPDENLRCDGRENFTLDSESVTSLSKNLTELHVTGSNVMHLGNLSRLTILNLGGKTCRLSEQSNLFQLADSHLARVSLRGCTSTRSLLYITGVTDLLRNVVYLDVSCADIAWENVKCALPPSLRVLILDQDPSKFRNLAYCSSGHSLNFNLTAASFSSYQGHVGTSFLPQIDGTAFPVLTRLDVAHISGNVVTWTAKLLNMSTTRLSYLEYLDVSSIQSQTVASCPHPDLRHHPWFLARDYHDLPAAFSEIKPCHICIPPRLKTLYAQKNEHFPLDFADKFESNNLTLVDISYGDYQPPRFSNIKGLGSVKHVVAQKAVQLNLSFILIVFPGMISLNLDGGSEIFSWSSVFHANLIDLSLNNYAHEDKIFPNRTFIGNISKSFPALQNLSLLGNRIKNINITLPANLLYLDLSDNDIYTIAPDMRQKLSAHAKKRPLFQLHLSKNTISCNCGCDDANLEYLKWLAASTFVLFDQLCDDGSAYASPADCVSADCSEMAMPPYAIPLIISIGVFLVAVIVLAFGIWYRYQWRIRIWAMAKFTKSVQRDPTVANIFYMSFCTNCEEQSAMAFAIWDKARRSDLGIVIKSRYDILPGEWQNYMISKSIRGAHKVLLFMPDEQYALHDNSMYEFLLAIKFLDISNVHPILRVGVDSLDGISARFPPLLPDALKPYCRSIYPTSSLDLEEFLNHLVLLSNSVFDGISS